MIVSRDGVDYKATVAQVNPAVSELPELPEPDVWDPWTDHRGSAIFTNQEHWRVYHEGVLNGCGGAGVVLIFI